MFALTRRRSTSTMHQTNYLRVCTERRNVHALVAGEVPPVGAHLITPWLGFTHHGIYVGSGKVVHYGALMYDIIRKPVEEVTLDGFAEGRPVYVVEHTEVCFDARRGDSPCALAPRREALSPVHQQLRALRRMVHARYGAQLPGGNRAGVSAAHGRAHRAGSAGFPAPAAAMAPGSAPACRGPRKASSRGRGRRTQVVFAGSRGEVPCPGSNNLPHCWYSYCLHRRCWRIRSNGRPPRPTPGTRSIAG